MYTLLLPENISFFSFGIILVINAVGCSSAKAPAHSTTARLEGKYNMTKRDKFYVKEANKHLILNLSKSTQCECIMVKASVCMFER